MSYRDGLWRLRPTDYAHPIDRPYATLRDALAGATWLSRVVGRVFLVRDGVTKGHVYTGGDGTACREND